MKTTMDGESGMVDRLLRHPSWFTTLFEGWMEKFTMKGRLRRIKCRRYQERTKMQAYKRKKNYTLIG